MRDIDTSLANTSCINPDLKMFNIASHSASVFTSSACQPDGLQININSQAWPRARRRRFAAVVVAAVEATAEVALFPLPAAHIPVTVEVDIHRQEDSSVDIHCLQEAQAVERYIAVAEVEVEVELLKGDDIGHNLEQQVADTHSW